MDDKEKWVPMGTKVSPDMAQVFSACCDALGCDTYHLLQGFIACVVRASADWHRKTPAMERLLNMIDLDVSWQKAINLCAPNLELDLSQLVMIVEAKDMEGFRAVMLNKPYMEECTQTENANMIFDRVLEVIYPKTYRRIRKLSAVMNIENRRNLLEALIDSQIDILEDRADREAMEGVNDFAENNRRVEYGKRTKQVRRRTPDEFYKQGVLDFDQQQERVEDAHEASDWLQSDEGKEWMEDIDHESD